MALKSCWSKVGEKMQGNHVGKAVEPIRQQYIHKDESITRQSLLKLGCLLISILLIGILKVGLLHQYEARYTTSSIEILPYSQNMTYEILEAMPIFERLKPIAIKKESYRMLEDTNVEILATNAAYSTFEKLQFVEGSFFTEQAVREGRNHLAISERKNDLKVLKTIQQASLMGLTLLITVCAIICGDRCIANETIGSERKIIQMICCIVLIFLGMKGLKAWISFLIFFVDEGRSIKMMFSDNSLIACYNGFR